MAVYQAHQRSIGSEPGLWLPGFPELPDGLAAGMSEGKEEGSRFCTGPEGEALSESSVSLAVRP